MSVLSRVVGQDGKLRGYMIFCPGCKCGHLFTTEPFERDGKTVTGWSFDGNMEKPTFSPSMLCNASHLPTRCHSFVRSGMIQFLGDCHHDLKGQTVSLPETY